MTAREGEQLIGQLRAPFRGPHRILQIFQHAFVFDVALGQLEVRDNRCQKIVEIMSDTVGELTDRLHLL